MNPLYQATVPAFVKHLKALDAILAKAEEWANVQGISEEELLNTRLAPDMFPFAKQVQVACDNAKGAAGRLSSTEIPSHADEEKTLSELRARIQKTLEYIQSIPESAYAGAADTKATFPYFPGKYMTGEGYAREYAVPNFFFHTTTAYGILRMKGMPIGKADFMGGLPLLDI